MLVTKQQGIACRKAAEYIASGKWMGDQISFLPGDENPLVPYLAIGGPSRSSYDQSEVIMALLWCAEIAGEE